MPLLYHGTSRLFAVAMAETPGTIDVSRGRGEFGQGFYTQDSPGNAARRGQLLYGGQGALLILDVDDLAYHSLRFRRLTLPGARTLDRRLRKNQTVSTYTTNQDAIVGPLVRQPMVTQQKFQSLNAQHLLNGQPTTRAVSP